MMAAVAEAAMAVPLMVDVKDGVEVLQKLADQRRWAKGPRIGAFECDNLSVGGRAELMEITVDIIDRNFAVRGRQSLLDFHMSAHMAGAHDDEEVELHDRCTGRPDIAYLTFDKIGTERHFHPPWLGVSGSCCDPRSAASFRIQSVSVK
jgi:hypothetical protein